MISVFLVSFLCAAVEAIKFSTSARGLNEKRFSARPDHALNGHVVATYQASSTLDCSFACLGHSKCRSYNFKHDGSSTHQCEINNATKTEHPLSFVYRPGVTYFQPEMENMGCPEGVVFVANFTTLGASGRHGPTELGNHYQGQVHEGQVMVFEGIQQWTVPCSGCFRIETVGASGGYGQFSSHLYRGFGARMIGTFQLSHGDVIKILVGQEGESNSAGESAGGGTFVVRSDNTPLIIAGGGGGSKGFPVTQLCHGSNTSSGNPGYPLSWLGGANGFGAPLEDKSYGIPGGGGGGLLSSGRSSTGFGGAKGNGGEGGKGLLQGGVGGRSLQYNARGGFGGGAGGHGGDGGSGGGGGYSGGGSGPSHSNSCGGGGGSFNSGYEQANSCCYNNNGDGFVVVTYIT